MLSDNGDSSGEVINAEGITRQGSSPVNLESAIRKLILQWRGLLTIEYAINADTASALAADDYIAWAASEVIDAAITNANAHGGAKFVWITVALDPDPGALVITIDDDGTGPPDQVKPGMGLDGIVALGGQWHMTRGSRGGCSLRVTFPIT